MFSHNPAPKPQFKRNKPTQKQKGDISPKVRKQLHERSGDVCEVCGYRRAVHAAHLISRKRIEHKTTVNDLVHSCLDCHMNFLDATKEGRLWKEQFRELLMIRGLEESYETKNNGTKH